VISFFTEVRAIVSASSCLGAEDTVRGKGRDEWRVRAFKARVSAIMHQKWITRGWRRQEIPRTSMVWILFEDSIRSLEALLVLLEFILRLHS
jgi:hypothetical protein